MEELGSEDEELRSTGVELARGSRSRGGYAYQDSDDEDGDSTEDDDTEQDTEDEDNELVQAAMARIRKAQEKGKQDVRLSKKELAALERHRKRMEGGDRRRKKEERIAVPLAQFDMPAAESSSSRRRSRVVSDDTLPRHPSPSTLTSAQGRPGPPVGLFPPPNAARSSSSSSRHLATQRHPSETSSRSASGRVPYPADDNDYRSTSSLSLSSRQGPDPFAFQTSGPRASYSYTDPATVRRDLASSSGPASATRSRQGTSVAAAVKRFSHVPSSEDPSEEDGDATTSDEVDTGAYAARNRSREDAVMVEPESTRTRIKRSDSKPSSSKRKPVSSSGGGSGSVGASAGAGASGRRRKGK